MKYAFNQSVRPQRRPGRPGFTLVEIVAALAILVGIISGVLVVMNKAVGATIEMRSRRRAFEVARENLESLLTASSVSDQTEYGYSEKYPEIRWELRVEPFYEPISNQMWVRAVSIAGFRDGADQEQTIELEHWLTGLSAAQIKQILKQRETEEKILEELYGDQDSEIQERTKICLQRAGLNVSAYENFLQRQRREKLDYLLEHGFDEGYDRLTEALEADEAAFLVELGANLDQLDDCITLLEENPNLMTGSQSTDLSESEPEMKPEEPGTEPESQTEEPPVQEPDICADIDCSTIAPELRPIICHLLNCCCE